MELSGSDIQRIVARVLDTLGDRVPLTEAAGPPRPVAGRPRPAGARPMVPTGTLEGVFATMDMAVREAGIAQERLLEHSVAQRDAMIASMRRRFLEQARYLSELAVRETGMGRVEDKVFKNELAARKTPGVEDIRPTAYSGDDGLTLIEQGPFGVIGAVTPCTNPSETVVCNSIGMIAGGNAVVFNPHPRAKQVCLETISLLNKAVVEAGGPANLMTTVAQPSIQTSSALMNHPDVDLLVVTGGEAVVHAAFQAGKKVIAAGPGNPPVIVDETADLARAARHIVDGASFDNNLLCIAEKEIFCVASVADELIRHMKSCGAYQLIGGNVARLERLLFADGAYQTQWVGKDAAVILRGIGIDVGPELRLVLVETDGAHPFVVTEMLTPVIPIVRVPDVEAAIALAVEAEGNCRHTAHMHSRDLAALHRAARRVKTTIFVKNGPSVAGLGFGGEGFTSYTIATPTGEGITSARTFTRRRRCVLKDYFRII